MFLAKNKNKGGKKVKDTLHNPKILDVNLIKDEIRVSFDWNKNLSILVIVLFITFIFIAELYFGLSWWEKQENTRAEALNESVSKVSREVTELKVKSDEALNYQRKAFEVSRLLDEHVYWSNLFSWLERNTLSSVSYKAFSGNLSGEYDLVAKASSYADVSWQVKTFLDDPATKNVEVTTANAIINEEEDNEREIKFIVNLELDPEIFKK